MGLESGQGDICDLKQMYFEELTRRSVIGIVYLPLILFD
jgi:hypothetical protein